MFAMCFFISLLGYGLFIKLLFPRLKMGVSMFCAFICMAILSYTFMIVLGIFVFSAYLLMYGGIIAFFVTGIIGWSKYKKNKYCFLNKLDFFVIFVYMACVICFVVLLSDGVLKMHDAYSFWARASRELYLFDKDYFNADTNIEHWDYNPIFATLQYAITKVFGWRTKYLYYVIIGALTTSLCAIIELIKSYRSKLAFILLSIYFYPMIAITYSTTFLGADGPMALLFVTAVLCWHSREKDDFTSVLPLILATIILPSVKLYSGLMLSVVLGVMFFTSILKNKDRILKIGFAVMVIGILYMQFSWSAYYNYNVDKAIYERSIAVNEYQGIETDNSLEKPVFRMSYLIKGNPRTKQLSTEINKDNVSEMFQLCKKSIMRFVGGTLYNSSLYIVTIVFLTMFAYIVLAKAERNAGSRQMFHTIIWLWIAAIIYLLGMFGTYLVQPGTANEPIRYIGVVVIPMVISLLYYACKYWDEKGKLISEISQKILLIVLLILMLDCKPEKVLEAYSAGKSLEYKPATYVKNVLENELNEIWELFSDEERVLIIDNKEENKGLGSSGVIYAYRYYALPRRGTALYFEFENKETIENTDDDFWERTLRQNRIDKIIVMSDDKDLQNKLTNVFGISINGEVQLIDVVIKDGNINYSLEGMDKI